MAPKKDNDLGKHYGKWDIDRCGLFIETGYDSNKKKLTKKGDHEKKVQFTRGVKNYATTNYFDSEFKSIYTKDKFIDKWRQDQLERKDKLKWHYTSDTKKHATPGDYFGTFIENMKAFSPLCHKGKHAEKVLKNFLTSPGKKGGPGYIDITIAKYPKHEYLKKRLEKIDKNAIKPPVMYLTFPPRNCFNNENIYMKFKSRKEKPSMFPEKVFLPASAPGFINKFPDYRSDRRKKIKTIGVDKEKFIHPWGNNKSFYTVSIINNKIKTACNGLNYTYMKPITYPLD